MVQNSHLPRLLLTTIVWMAKGPLTYRALQRYGRLVHSMVPVTSLNLWQVYWSMTSPIVMARSGSLDIVRPFTDPSDGVTTLEFNVMSAPPNSHLISIPAWPLIRHSKTLLSKPCDVFFFCCKCTLGSVAVEEKTLLCTMLISLLVISVRDFSHHNP